MYAHTTMHQSLNKCIPVIEAFLAPFFELEEDSSNTIKARLVLNLASSVT
jgi:hypothetical protein